MATNKKSNYSTIAAEDGAFYRDIAQTMTELGFSMNHSSARNHVVRIMSKFAKEIIAEWGDKCSEETITRIAKSPTFQQGISDILHAIEQERRIEG